MLSINLQPHVESQHTSYTVSQCGVSPELRRGHCERKQKKRNQASESKKADLFCARSAWQYVSCLDFSGFVSLRLWKKQISAWACAIAACVLRCRLQDGCSCPGTRKHPLKAAPKLLLSRCYPQERLPSLCSSSELSYVPVPSTRNRDCQRPSAQFQRTVAKSIHQQCTGSVTASIVYPDARTRCRDKFWD